MKRQSSTKLRRELVFFTDRDLGHIVPDRLHEAGVRVERHDQHFGPTTSDVEWLRVVGERGWVALTHNREIRYNREECDMVMRAGVALFLLVGRHPHPVLARNLVQTLPKVRAFVNSTSPPYIAKVHKPSDEQFNRGRPGRVVLWLSFDEWRGHAEK